MVISTRGARGSYAARPYQDDGDQKTKSAQHSFERVIAFDDNIDHSQFLPSRRHGTALNKALDQTLVSHRRIPIKFLDRPRGLVDFTTTTGHLKPEAQRRAALLCLPSPVMSCLRWSSSLERLTRNRVRRKIEPVALKSKALFLLLEQAIRNFRGFHVAW